MERMERMYYLDIDERPCVLFWTGKLGYINEFVIAHNYNEYQTYRNQVLYDDCHILTAEEFGTYKIS